MHDGSGAALESRAGLDPQNRTDPVEQGSALLGGARMGQVVQGVQAGTRSGRSVTTAESKAKQPGRWALCGSTGLVPASRGRLSEQKEMGYLKGPCGSHGVAPNRIAPPGEHEIAARNSQVSGQRTGGSAPAARLPHVGLELSNLPRPNLSFPHRQEALAPPRRRRSLSGRAHEAARGITLEKHSSEAWSVLLFP